MNLMGLWNHFSQHHESSDGQESRSPHRHCVNMNKKCAVYIYIFTLIYRYDLGKKNYIALQEF